MSRVGRLLLWTKAPRSLRHFNTLCRTPGQAQERLLREILGRNAGTEFGRRHGFAGITTLPEFQERVPISTYEDLEPYINEEIWANSSGSSPASAAARSCSQPSSCGNGSVGTSFQDS
jgi:hypothetical protein